ncbi:Hypothetical protein PHPALM_11109 [Phytophthora palmivora]|uniref:Solute carrier family 40 member n=1 Tax=Phytophthora palmivora TaxID=4796 RepID=A0A2P4Y310_9STRA|nr:Hypothetical protein PHPALM_11109 [Phytophthora palmivora]
MWAKYAKHPVFLVSFSFCALYMTILDGGALNTAYLKWRGVSNSLLGASRGAGALAGLVGTLIFPCLQSRMKRVERIAVLNLAETQIMQEWITPNQRGAINSMQTATCQLFYILILLSGMVFHDPRQFETLLVFSLAAVFASAIGFTYWNIKYGRHRDLYVSTKDTPLKA